VFVIANNDGDIAHGLNIERLNYIWARLDISFINAYGDLLESIIDTRGEAASCFCIYSSSPTKPHTF
jgi:hypothetical protein